ncbi:IS4 family transposase [Paraburkholderia sediminicola]|uniref:IS4 family transposase n=1 Tax=Paraburkholderia sediminicola TaxID=458836 RepID=UPI0038BAE499
MVRRLERAGLSYPLPLTLSDDELEARLFPPPARVEGERPAPHWPTVRRELARKGVTLDLLWNEYKAEHPDGYAYTWFCTRYSEWANALPLTLRQTHAPGEKLFVDYSGDKVAIINADTGEIREAELFVAVLGASNYTYAEATWTHQVIRMIASLGGFLGRKSDGEPGAKTLWIGMQRVMDAVISIQILRDGYDTSV